MAHGLAVAARCVRGLFDQFDRDFKEVEAECDGDAVVAVEVAVVSVEPHSQRDAYTVDGDALGQAVEVSGSVDDVRGRRYDFAVDGTITRDKVGV